MKPTNRGKASRAAKVTVLLGGFFAGAAAAVDGYAYIYETPQTTTTIICGNSIVTTSSEGSYYGEGGNVTIEVSSQCNPAALLAFLNANFQNLTNFYANISNYMEMFRNGFGGTINFTAYRPGAPTFQVATRGDLEGLGPQKNQPLFIAQAPSSVGEGSKFAVWAYGTGSFGHVAADGAAAGYRHRSGGFLAGFDWQTDQWMVGAHGGYAGTTIRVRDDGSHVSISHAIFGVHGAFRWDNFYVDGILNAGFLDHDVTQSLTPLGFPGNFATGGPNGHTVGGKLEIGAILRQWALEFNPYSALQVVYLHTDSYTLSSSSTSIAVGSVDTTSVRLTFAAQVGKRWHFADGSNLKLNLRVGWVGELADSRQNTAVSALGGSVNFNATSNSLGRNFALIGANAHYQMARNFGFLFDYRVETSSRSTSHALLGGVRYTW